MKRKLWGCAGVARPILGAIVAALGAADCGMTVSVGAACGGGDVCDGACVHLASDPGNCGACGHECPVGVVCSGGVCSSACPVGEQLCEGSCVDVGTDPKHCGACDAPCSSDRVCTAGACECATPGAVDCGGLCVDPTSDPLNCGKCFAACPPETKCAAGICQPACPPGLSLCDAGCVDSLDDPSNCGGCDIVCGPSEICFEGSCVCRNACGACLVTDLGSAVPQAISGKTSGRVDAMSPSCAPPGSPELVFSFTAPFDGNYDFDTLGSSYDTSLYVLDDGCAELACNDDNRGFTSKVTVTMFGGQTVFLVVDGVAGSDGEFVLDVAPTPPCMPTDLGSTVPQTVMGSTFGGPDQLSGSCGPTGIPEAAFVFTAPATGMYGFDTLGSSYDTVLFVLDMSCDGPEIACDDDTNGLTSQVNVPLFAGEVVVIVVDGFSEGDFVLNVN